MACFKLQMNLPPFLETVLAGGGLRFEPGSWRHGARLVKSPPCVEAVRCQIYLWKTSFAPFHCRNTDCSRRVKLFECSSHREGLKKDVNNVSRPFTRDLLSGDMQCKAFFWVEIQVQKFWGKYWCFSASFGHTYLTENFASICLGTNCDT